jgi:hypothetical protein
MPIYVPGKLTLQKEYIGIDDPDAQAYITAVEATDQVASPGVAPLELGVKIAIHSFVKGCKADGIWPAIKASCILAGARTLQGCLVPLVGAAPTNFNFVAGDYNRKTGLVGNGSTKYLDTNRNNNADPQNSKHLSAFASSIGNAVGSFLAAGGSQTGRSFISASAQVTINRQVFFTGASAVAPTFIGAARTDSDSVVYRVNLTSSVISSGPSETPANANILAYNRPGANLSNHRLSFYSIGESLNLALLDARVTALIDAIAAAIP